MEKSVFFGLMLRIILGLSIPQAQSCCIPDQLEGLMTATLSSFSLGGPRQTFIISELYMDNTNKRFASYANVTESFGEPFFLKTLELHSASGTQLRSWQTSPWEQQTSLSYEYKIPNTARQASITVLRNLCVPVSVLVTEDVDRAPSVPFMASFANIKLGISRPSVFDVPPEC